jgi:hypothetical protein
MGDAMKMTDARRRVLSKLAAADGWLRKDDFYSLPPAKVSMGRGTRMGRKLRGLPYGATFAPLLAAGLIEERDDRYSRKEFRITDAGRAAAGHG